MQVVADRQCMKMVIKSEFQVAEPHQLLIFILVPIFCKFGPEDVITLNNQPI